MLLTEIFVCSWFLKEINFFIIWKNANVFIDTLGFVSFYFNEFPQMICNGWCNQILNYHSVPFPFLLTSLVHIIIKKHLTCCPLANQSIICMYENKGRGRLKKSPCFKVKICWNNHTLEASASWAAWNTSSCSLCKARDSKIFLLAVIKYV